MRVFLEIFAKIQILGTKAVYDANPLKITRDLQMVFGKFPDFEHSNTVMISNFNNIKENFVLNDVLFP